MTRKLCLLALLLAVASISATQVVVGPAHANPPVASP
jgi:hypothetical protein